MHDLRIAFTIWGYLRSRSARPICSPGARQLFEGVGNTNHHYAEGRRIADMVPESTLRMTPQQVDGYYPARWRSLLGIASGDRMSTPQEGKKAPTIALPDQNGEPVKLSSFKGRRVLVYFYPKADTPGCTIQACGLRDIAGQIGDTVILGISPDKPPRLKKFDDKYGLGFTLLSDEDHAVAEAYGVWVEKKNYGKTYMGVQRSAFLIGDRRQGREGLADDQPQGHADQPARRRSRRAEQQTLAPHTQIAHMSTLKGFAAPHPNFYEPPVKPGDTPGSAGVSCRLWRTVARFHTSWAKENPRRRRREGDARRTQERSSTMNSSAGVSSSALTRCTKVAASQPSTMRWSKLDDRLNIWRGSNEPLRQTGRVSILLTPTIATSGALRIGVVTSPPSAPSDVIVIVEPDSSSRVAEPSRAAVVTRAISAARSQRPRASTCATTGTSRPSSVCVAMPTCTASNVVSVSAAWS